MHTHHRQCNMMYTGYEWKKKTPHSDQNETLRKQLFRLLHIFFLCLSFRSKNLKYESNSKKYYLNFVLFHNAATAFELCIWQSNFAGMSFNCSVFIILFWLAKWMKIEPRKWQRKKMVSKLLSLYEPVCIERIITKCIQITLAITSPANNITKLCKSDDYDFYCGCRCATQFATLSVRVEIIISSSWYDFAIISKWSGNHSIRLQNVHIYCTERNVTSFLQHTTQIIKKRQS